MDELTRAPGEWWTMDGRAPDEPLVIERFGPLLAAAKPGRVVVTGYRRVDGARGPWIAVQVRDDDGGGGWPASFGDLRQGSGIVYGQPGRLSGPNP